MLNLNYSFYGYRSNNQLVNNVIIDFIKKSEFPYLISDYVHLIIEHKKLLNSNLISSNIHEWINNICEKLGLGINSIIHDIYIHAEDDVEFKKYIRNVNDWLDAHCNQ